MEQFKTFVNTSENINPIFKVEFPLDCKVIYEFDLSLSKTFHCFGFPLSGQRGRAGEIVWFGFGAGKDDMM